MMMVYLDYASTTPLDPEILQEMIPYLSGLHGNASSVHAYGREARMAIERSRNRIAKALGVEQGEVLFTGSASEANNLVIKGVVERASQIVRDQGSGFLPEIVVSSIEHPCVMEAARHVERLGWVKVVWLPVTQSGHVRVEDVEAAVNERTVLVSVGYVNNEIGSVQPIREIGEVVKRERVRRERTQNAERRTQNHCIDLQSEISDLPLYSHTDAVQALQYFDCSPAALGVDLMTLAPHKAYGPKGVGVLYKRSDVQLVRQVDGGGQEYYLRAGTENVANVVGAGMAVERAVEVARAGDEQRRLYKLRSYLVDCLENSKFKIINPNGSQILDGIPVRGHSGYQISELDQRSDICDLLFFAPHILSMIVPDCDAEMVVAALDREGFAVSSGSACSSGVVKKSHVIEALNLGIEKYAPVRVSMGRGTTEEDIRSFANALIETSRKIRDLGI